MKIHKLRKLWRHWMVRLGGPTAAKDVCGDDYVRDACALCHKEPKKGRRTQHKHVYIYIYIPNKSHPIVQTRRRPE